MKKLSLAVAALAAIFSANAQTPAYYEMPKFSDNWSLGVDAGVTTPLMHHAFFGDMRAQLGLHFEKHVSPVFTVGVEAQAAINTHSWYEHNQAVLDAGYDLTGNSKSALDRFRVTAYTKLNVVNLFGGARCERRFFDIDVMAGAGWGYQDMLHQNYFLTKAGLEFNFNFTKYFTLSLKPAVVFNMTGTDYEPLNVSHTSCAYNRALAGFDFNVGFTYHFNPGFKCASVGDNSEIDALNATLNNLRAELDACLAASAANAATVAALQAELDACKNRAPQVIEKVSDNLQSVRYVFYKIGSSVITADQQPNVEMVASYMKHHKDAKVVVKGYASPDGNLDFNLKLAAARAESVKTMLVSKYGIAADRITAEGCGIGKMFSENDWNRVAICTLED
ncbi:MAG: OmpA family protein [Muribaculaceae bacterium]|nr:OmpA family protein [Muribaculaceae bacterium]